MKILLINISYYPNVEGGAEISTQKLAEELARTNEVYVLCHGNTETHEKINSVNVCRVPIRKKLATRIGTSLMWTVNITAYPKIKKVIGKIKPDVIHTNNIHEFSPIVWYIAKQMKIPVVHTLRDYSLLGGITHKVNRLWSRSVDAVTAPSEFTLKEHIDKAFFTKASQKRCVPNAIDYSKEELRKLIDLKMKKEDKIVRFAYLGRFQTIKGFDWLIHVFVMAENTIELHLFGKGEIQLKSQQIINTHSNIFNHGFLQEEQLYNELKEMDVVVAPSLWDEPFGRIIIDAYKAACPVIITNRGGMPEIVDNRKTGIVLQTTKDEEFLEALSYFSNRNNIRDMLWNIENRIQDYSISEQARSFFEIYCKLVGKEEHDYVEQHYC